MSKERGTQTEGELSFHRRTVLSAVSGIALGAGVSIGPGGAQTVEEYEDTVSSIEYTPHPTATDVGGTESLGGSWEFALSTSAKPPSGSGRRVAPDLSGGGNDGTLANDPSTVTDTSEQALDLSSDARVTVGDASGVDFTSPGFTIQTTFRYDGDGAIWSKGDQYSLGVWGGGLSFWMEGSGDYPGIDAGDLSQGEWYTTTLVVDSSEIRLYLDTVEIGSTSIGFSSFSSYDLALSLGHNPGNGGNGSPVVDSFRAFDTALSGDQIGQTYDSVPNSAVAWLPMNTVTDGTTPDESGSGNDGALANSPAVVPGRYGEGLDLSGSGEVTVADADALNFTETGFTLRATFKYDGGGGLVLDKGSSTSGTEQFGLGIYDGTVSFFVQAADGSYPDSLQTSITTGTWHTVTVVVDDTESHLHLDGSQVGSVTHGANGLASSDAALAVGGNDLDVSVKAAAAFDTALSTAEIESGFRAIPDGAVLWHNYRVIEDRGVDWGTAEVPGQWGYDGYYVPSGTAEWYPASGELGWYRRDFAVPDGWEAGRLALYFGAVYSEAWVFLNGTQVGHHVGGYTPFEIDITDAVDTEGTNTLAVGVAQQSASDDMGWQNVTGGIVRDVTLLSVPEVHVDDVDVRTTLADDNTSATVAVDASVENTGNGSVDGATVTVDLVDPDGETIATVDRDVGSLAAGGSTTVSSEMTVSDPRTWNPEDPQLHTVDVTLNAGGSAETVSERIGIREVQVDGNKLRINGEAVTLRGVNWEEIHLPEHGHAIPAEITRSDARLLKEANINYVRAAHHPTSEAFLDACDELGIVVEVEAPHMFIGRHRGDPIPDVVVQQTVETIERDKNRASVCLWSIANESDWYDVFDTVGALAAELDPTRPAIFNHDDYDASDPWHEDYPLRADHYPAFRSDSTIADHTGFDDPTLFDEYAHTYCYNDRELVTDPGLRDEWGLPFERIWEACRTGESVAGAAIWAGSDHLEQWGEYLWGLVDRNRRPRPEYYHVKKVYSPVKVTDTEWKADGASVTLTIENRHEFVNLTERPIDFPGTSTGTTTLDVPPGESDTITVPVAGDSLEMTVSHPDGWTIDEYVFSPDRPSDSPSIAPAETTVEAEDGTFSVTDGPVSLHVDRETGSVDLRSDGAQLLVDAPDLVVTQTQQATGRNYETAIDHRPAGRTVTDVSIVEDGEAIEVSVEYDIATGTFVLRPLQGGLSVDYDFTMTASIDAREVGAVLPAAGGLTTLSWDRDGQWTAYPDNHIGRQHGTATAFPNGSRPDHEEIRIRSGQPWAEDATTHGSNDFRGTKRNVRQATLSDGDGRGLHVHADGEQHVRTTVQSETVDLLVLDRSLSGTNADAWLNRQPVMDQNPTLAVDDRLQGSVTVQAAGALSSPVGDASGVPTDPDGDGRFEDIDGDGEFTLADVQQLFDNLDSPTVQRNPEAFNFADRTSPQAVTLADVQALYNELTDTEQ